jgi:ketosteroid isomerase-like protein
MGRYEDQLQMTLAIFNERGPTMYEDPDVLAMAREWIDPDIQSVAAGGVQGGTYRGIDGLIEMVREFTSAFSELRAELVEATETEDSLLATVRYRGRGASSGAPIDETYVWAQRFRDGKAVTYVIDRDRDAAIRAAGLEP